MKKSRRSRLSQSSRVSDKVMEYYMKYGKDRKLEKFMRFRSPGGSQKSTTSTTTTSSSSDDWAKIGNLECLFNEREVNSEEHMAPISHDVPIASTSSDKEFFVPIEIETDDKTAHKNNKPAQFVESPKTPARKNEKGTTTKQTQTPESVAKSHKRLEWDSLADVGYKKSMSTSNISIVERMLLREFFEVTTNAPKNTNSSESDIRLLEQEIADLGTLRKHFSKPTPAVEESNYGTPPLASSTHVEVIKQKDRPKVHTVGTNTSTLQQKFEKFAQTSLRKPEMTSQEVQVTLTSPGISPLLGSSAEPSSFEYRSRLSTNSSEAKSTQSSSKQTGRHRAGEVQPNSNQNNEKLLQRRPLDTKNDNNTDTEVCERLKNLFISWNNMMEHNKENASSSSSCSNGSSTPQIDLGIQLICGIMKTKNIDQKQKKRLVRNIVKKITKIASSCELDAIVSKTATLLENSTDSSADIKEQTIEKSSVPVSKPSTSKGTEGQKMNAEQKKAARHPIKPATKPDIQQEQLSNIQKPTTKSKKVDSTLQNINLENCSANVTISTTEPQSSISTRNSTGASHTSQSLPASTTKAQSKTKTNPIRKPPNTSTIIETKASSSSSSTDLSGRHIQSLDISLCLSKTVSGGNLISAIIKQPEAKDSNSTTKSDSTTTSSSSSKNLPTQKAGAVTVREHISDAAEANKGTMQEWLNPMTQSEVEYEDKKRTLRADKKEHRPFNSARSGKYVELNWIDCEIERLQNLRHSLLKGRSTISTESDIHSQSREEHSAPTETTEKLYDTVYSDHSKSENRSASPVRIEISTKSDQKAYVSNKRTSKCNEPKGIVQPNEHREIHIKKKDTQQQQFAPRQRSKMDTPTDTIGNESVGSFVRQRKQEFLDHYKSQKLNHYDQIMHKYNDRPSTSKAAAAATQCLSDGGGHYSVPVPIQIQQPTAYYTYPPMHQYRDPCCYTQTVAPVDTVANRASSDMPTKAPHTASSELSVPMGSYNTNSTATTTHQYDIATMTAATVANKATIGSQTGRSLMHSRPIYETRCLSPYQICSMVPCSNYVACTCANIARTACVQVRPKGIAYSLQYETKPTKDKTADNIDNSSTSSEEYRTLDKAAAPSLQVALKHGNPKFLAHAKKRKSILNRIQKLRQERERELREIADDNTSLNSLDRKLGHLPPPVTERVRLFPTKQMKAMTNKHVAKLPEVLANKERERDLRFKRSNRLLREVYNRRLRDRVRGGRLNLNHSLTLI